MKQPEFKPETIDDHIYMIDYHDLGAYKSLAILGNTDNWTKYQLKKFKRVIDHHNGMSRLMEKIYKDSKNKSKKIKE